MVGLWAWLDRTWQGAALALGTGRGASTHLRPDYLGLPLWLPALYMLASLAVGNLGRWLQQEPPARRAPAGGR